MYILNGKCIPVNLALQYQLPKISDAMMDFEKNVFDCTGAGHENERSESHRFISMWSRLTRALTKLPFIGRPIQ
jgi:hypothetical protein